jgi:hypothetical protein
LFRVVSEKGIIYRRPRGGAEEKVKGNHGTFAPRGELDDMGVILYQPLTPLSIGTEYAFIESV